MKNRSIRQPVRLLATLAMLAAVLLGAAISVSAQPTGVLGPQDNVKICHATPSEANPYSMPNPNVSGILGSDNPGNAHDSHEGDIIPPFQYNLGQGAGVQSYPGKNWDATGQATYNNNCVPVVVKITVVPAVTVVDATCSTNPSITPVEVAGITYGIVGDVAPGGSVTVTATINPATHVFGVLTAGWTPVNASTATFSYTFADPDCRTVVSPLLPVVLQATCEDEAAVLIPAEPEGVTYSVTGTQAAGQTVTFTATIDPTVYVWGPIPSPLVKIDDATASWTFTFDAAPDCTTPSPSPTPGPSPTGVVITPTEEGVSPTHVAPTQIAPTQAPPAKTVTGMPNTGTGDSHEGQLWIAIAGAAALTVIAAGLRRQTKA